MFGYVLLGLLAGIFVGVNLGVILMGFLQLAGTWPEEER